jgi:dienelactone hydrolase
LREARATSTTIDTRLPSATEIAMAQKKVPYQVSGRQFEGLIIYDESVKAKRPAVFMQPDWKGVCADTIGQAHAVAGKDYVVLMADMFGAGYGDKLKTQQELAAGMRAVHADLAFTTACGHKAYATTLEEANALGLVDASKKAAIGYCAGGGFALEQARSGEDFKAVVVFHVTNPNPVIPGTPCNIKGRVLAIHGSADPITPAIILEKKEDMKKRGLASPDLADALALTFAYPVAASDHRWQLTGKPRHQYQYDPFQQAWTGRL